MTADTLELIFDFEELNIPICGKNAVGIQLFGTATLTGDEDGFYVDHIVLGNHRIASDSTHLRRRGNGWMGFPAAFEDELFARISSAIENPETAVGKIAERDWASLVEHSSTEAA